MILHQNIRNLQFWSFWQLYKIFKKKIIFYLDKSISHQFLTWFLKNIKVQLYFIVGSCLTYFLLLSSTLSLSLQCVKKINPRQCRRLMDFQEIIWLCNCHTWADIFLIADRIYYNTTYMEDIYMLCRRRNRFHLMLY